MARLISRLITIVVGVGCLVLGHFFKDLQLILYPAGAGIIGWATPHIAEAMNSKKDDSNDDPNST